MLRIALLAAMIALCLVPVGAAQAQFGAPSAPNQLTQPPPPPPPEAEKFDDGGLSTLQTVLIFGGATLVLALISFVIVRDARRAAPVDEPAHRDASSPPHKKAGAPDHNSSLSEIRARERQQAKRAKAKARNVRQQRKKNRPR